MKVIKIVLDERQGTRRLLDWLFKQIRNNIFTVSMYIFHLKRISLELRPSKLFAMAFTFTFFLSAIISLKMDTQVHFT